MEEKKILESGRVVMSVARNPTIGTCHCIIKYGLKTVPDNCISLEGG